jgi:hypothetical protein
MLKRIIKRLKTSDGCYHDNTYQIEVGDFVIEVNRTAIVVFDSDGFILEYKSDWTTLVSKCIRNARQREYNYKLLELNRIL